MNTKIDWNVVTLGRVLGVAIIVVGIALAAWDARAIHYPSEYNSEHFKLRHFFSLCIDYVWRGGLLLVAAELADRLGWGSRPSGEEPTAEGVQS